MKMKIFGIVAVCIVGFLLFASFVPLFSKPVMLGDFEAKGEKVSLIQNMYPEWFMKSDPEDPSAKDVWTDTLWAGKTETQVIEIGKLVPIGCKVKNHGFDQETKAKPGTGVGTFKMASIYQVDLTLRDSYGNKYNCLTDQVWLWDLTMLDADKHKLCFGIDDSGRNFIRDDYDPNKEYKEGDSRCPTRFVYEKDKNAQPPCHYASCPRYRNCFDYNTGKYTPKDTSTIGYCYYAFRKAWMVKFVFLDILQPKTIPPQGDNDYYTWQVPAITEDGLWGNYIFIKMDLLKAPIDTKKRNSIMTIYFPENAGVTLDEFHLMVKAPDPDFDGDGICNGKDPDIDGDGTPNSDDPTPFGEGDDVSNYNIGANENDLFGEGDVITTETPPEGDDTTTTPASPSEGENDWIAVVIIVAIILAVITVMVKKINEV